MKNSQLIALVILLIAVSVFVWVGAFSGDNDKDDEVLKPVGTLQTGSQTATAEPEPTPTADNTEKPTETPSQTPITTHSIKNSDFEKYDNTFEYWSVNFTTDEADNQNYPYVNAAVTESIKEIEAIPSVQKELEVGGASRFVISHNKIDGDTEVYLTFSISFENGFTKEILDILASRGIKATFFVTRDYMESNTELVSEIYKAGHIIGIKAPSDGELAEMSAEALAAELVETEKVYRGIVGESERMLYYRSTYFSERSAKVAEALGYTVVFNTYSTNSQSWADDTNGDVEKARGRLWERATYDGSVPELTSTELVADALEMYVAEALDANVKFVQFS